MKYKNIVLKSFLAVALVMSLSSPVIASEVLGTLSSGTPSSNSTPGTISGSVTSPTNSGGGKSTSGGNSGGAVLGVSTTPLRTNLFSSDGQAVEPSSQSLAIGGPRDEVVAVTPTEDVQLDGSIFSNETYPQTAAAADATGMSSWIWVSLLLLLIIAIALYMYDNSTKRNVKIVGPKS